MADYWTARCTICLHPERQAIEEQLINRVSSRVIAERFDLPSHMAVLRHRDHLSRDLLVALKESEKHRLGDMLDHPVHLIHETDEIRTEARMIADHRAALMAVREGRETMALLGRMGGDFQDHLSLSLDEPTKLLGRLLPEAFGNGDTVGGDGTDGFDEGEYREVHDEDPDDGDKE